MEIKKGQMVLVSSRYHGMVWFCAESDSDEYGEFMAHDQDGLSQLIHVDDVDQVG